MTRSLSQYRFWGRYVWKFTCITCSIVATRVTESCRVSYLCHCLATDVCQQHAPILGRADRIGKAKIQDHDVASVCVMWSLPIQPVLQTKNLLTQERVNVLCLAETSATQEVQAQCQKDLTKIGFKARWSNPVAPQRMCQNGAASTRGRAGGTAILADIPMRACRNPLPNEWGSTTRFVHTIASWGRSHVQICSLYSIPQSHQNAKEYLNNLLQMTLQQAMTSPLPFIVCGDFNLE